MHIAAASNDSPSVEAVVRDVNLAGPLVYLELDCLDDGTVFELEVPSEHAVKSRRTPAGACM